MSDALMEVTLSAEATSVPPTRTIVSPRSAGNGRVLVAEPGAEGAGPQSGERGIPRPQAQQAMMHIGDLAARAGTTTRTIRYYEELGIIAPEQRTGGGFRLYSDTQLKRLEIVRELKALGLCLDRIQALFMQPQKARTGGELARALRAELEERQQEIEERLTYYRELKARNERAISVLSTCLDCTAPLSPGASNCVLLEQHPRVPERIPCASSRGTDS